MSSAKAMKILVAAVGLAVVESFQVGRPSIILGPGSAMQARSILLPSRSCMGPSLSVLKMARADDVGDEVRKGKEEAKDVGRQLQDQASDLVKRAENKASQALESIDDVLPDDLKSKKAKDRQQTRIAGFFALWYLLNVGYNVYNKGTLNMISIPWTLSAVQLAVGSLYVGLLWALGFRKAPRLEEDALGFRKAPRLEEDDVKALVPLAALHTISHICAVIGLGAGAVGFVHIVKAMEPLFTATFTASLLGQVYPAPVYAALLPVVAGVALASLKELTFSWTAFGGAMGSNIAAALRGVLSKKSMDKPKGQNMDPGNLYGVMTIMATLFLTPAALLVEGPRLRSLWKAANLAGHSSAAIWRGITLSGLFFYLYNEVAFYCLNEISPITHAVGNTLKRVVLLGVSVVVFGHKLTPLGYTGSAVAIGGVLLYSLTKNHYTDKRKAKGV